MNNARSPSLNLELTDLARLADQRDPRTHLPPPPSSSVLTNGHCSIQPLLMDAEDLKLKLPHSQGKLFPY